MPNLLYTYDINACCLSYFFLFSFSGSFKGLVSLDKILTWKVFLCFGLIFVRNVCILISSKLVHCPSCFDLVKSVLDTGQNSILKSHFGNCPNRSKMTWTAPKSFCTYILEQSKLFWTHLDGSQNILEQSKLFWTRLDGSQNKFSELNFELFPKRF